MIPLNLRRINFIYFPEGLWDTTRSRRSRQGYFQIYFPCKSCKWTKHYFFVYYFIWLTSKDPKTSFTPAGWGVGGGGCREFNGRLIPIACLLFSASFFFKLVKSIFQPLSFDCIKFSLKQPFLDYPKFRINVSSRYFRIPLSSLLLF